MQDQIKVLIWKVLRFYFLALATMYTGIMQDIIIITNDLFALIFEQRRNFH